MYPSVPEEVVQQTIEALKKVHPSEAGARVEKGVSQVAAFWRATDGNPNEFKQFCEQWFLTDPGSLTSLLHRFDRNIELLGGHQVALTRGLREPTDLEGDKLPVDLLFAGLDPFSHLNEDMFSSKIAFVALLNFPLRSLDSLVRDGERLSRREWAEARLARYFSMRVPGEVIQQQIKAYTEGDEYISGYNIPMARIVTESGARLFEHTPDLISHWGLRDEIRARYSDPVANLESQRMILKIMKRIIRQEIPAAVLSNPGLDWAPESNRVGPTAPGAVRSLEGMEPAPREEDVRYARLLDIFHAEQALDRVSPAYPTLPDRRFSREREIPEDQVRRLLEAVVSSPEAGQVAEVIRARLGRPLEEFDIWYDGFKNRSQVPEEELNARVSALYPTREAFQAALPTILTRLGFSEETANFLGSKIVVDPSRGAGHAFGAGMRSDQAHLRTRIAENGMNYKGYNIAIHELGHNVEQVFSLNRVDWVLLSGVPNTAFTEAFAFLFQARDLELLSEETPNPDPGEQANRILDLFWSTYEISGVALVDMAVWRYMYEHPDLTPSQLRDAVITIAQDIWDRYYAPVIGVEHSPLLAIYSHMIDAGLYLPDYPIGFLIKNQLEAYMEGRNLGVEMERMCVQGSITPEAWMKAAVGAPLSAEPLLESVRKALARL